MNRVLFNGYDFLFVVSDFLNIFYLLIGVGIIVLLISKKFNNTRLVNKLFLILITLPVLVEWLIKAINLLIQSLYRNHSESWLNLGFFELFFLSLCLCLFLWAVWKKNRKLIIISMAASVLVWIYVHLSFFNTLKYWHPRLFDYIFVVGRSAPLVVTIAMLFLYVRRKFEFEFASYHSMRNFSFDTSETRRNVSVDSLCSACGAVLDEDANFCVVCGNPVNPE